MDSSEGKVGEIKGIMGSSCSGNQRESGTKQAKLKVKSAWKTACLQSLGQVFPQEQTEAWFHELLTVIHCWLDGVEAPFQPSTRWNVFAGLSQDSDLLRYQIWKQESTGGPKSLFEVLSDDIADPRNPIGALLASFRTIYSTQSHDKVQSLVDEKRREEASFVLAQSISVIQRFVFVMKMTMKAFYGALESLLEEHEKDLEALLLSQLVQGDLFLLLERLSNVVYLDQSDCNRASTDSTASLTRMKSVWLRFLACESISEKRELLESLPDLGTTEFLRLMEGSTAELPTIVPHLHLTKLLSSSPDPVLETCLKAVKRVDKQEIVP